MTKKYLWDKNTLPPWLYVFFYSQIESVRETTKDPFINGWVLNGFLILGLSCLWIYIQASHSLLQSELSHETLIWSTTFIIIISLPPLYSHHNCGKRYNPRQVQQTGSFVYIIPAKIKPTPSSFFFFLKVSHIKFSFKLTGKFSICPLGFILGHGWSCVYFYDRLSLPWPRKTYCYTKSSRNTQCFEELYWAWFCCNSSQQLCKILRHVYKSNWGSIHFPKYGILPIKLEIMKMDFPSIIFNDILKKSKG